MTLGRSTQGKDIPYVVGAVKKTVDRLREITAM